MITENELILNNQSYINKDFDSVYRELITLAKQISYRYDPTSSNESDPFIVLTKLLAFATDKVNYNIDKELLERFILSCTQEESMQDITSRLGYNMHYYIAAQTTVNITYSGNFETNEIEVELPQHTVLGTTVDGIQYLTTESVTFTKDSLTVQDVPVIECQSLNTFTVVSDYSSVGTENTNITLSNLDENRRLYFPEIMVAQNGVFISGGISVSEQMIADNDSTSWKLVDNLNTVNYGSLSYRFGYDSLRALPYIEFPEWIDKIIGSGLTIQYAICKGLAGNIGARGIRNIQSIQQPTSGSGPSSSNFTVTNLNAAQNGKDPETINEAYQGFKKTIGTFDTLVTCRDYANKIYNLLKDSTGTPYVSNIQVGDRRDDINYSCNVVEYTEYGIQTKSEIKINDTTRKPVIAASDLVLYPLNPITSLSFEKINYSPGYDDTYTRLKDTEPIKAELEDTKYICHDYKNLKSNDIIVIKNIYQLDVVLYTTYKVNNVEQLQIISNVSQALANNFNSRELEYGYEIPLDSLQEVITNADSRIKLVSLNIPDKRIEALLKRDGTSADKSFETHNESGYSNDWYNDIVAKNVLSGKAELFDYDERFDYDYDQSENAIQQVQSISTYPFGLTGNNPEILTLSNPAPAANSDNAYTLRKNEVIQIAIPSLKPNGTVYPFPVKYAITIDSSSTLNNFLREEDNNKYLPKGTYQLGDNDELVFNYTKNETPQTDSYTEGTIFEINKDLKVVSSSTYLPQGTEVSIKAVNEVKLESATRCYWYTSNSTNSIDWQPDASASSKYNYTLNDNEYFFYTDDSYSYLSVCESGTRLVLTSSSNPSLNNDWSIDSQDKIEISKVLLEGLEAIGDKFKYFLFNKTDYNLKLVEQKIITLTEKDTIQLESGSAVNITQNIFSDIEADSKIKYTIDDGTESGTSSYVDNLSISGYARYIRALLDINSGPDLSQELINNDSTYPQTIVLNPGSDDPQFPEASITNKNFLFDILIQKSGGKDIDLKYTNYYSEEDYPNICYYMYSAPTKSPNNTYYKPTEKHYYALFDSSSAANASISLKLPKVANEDAYILCKAEGAENTTFNITSDGTRSDYLGTSLNSIAAGETKIIKISENYTYIKFSKTSADDTATLFISSPRLSKGINPLLDVSFASGDFIDFLKTNYNDQAGKFYATHYINPDKKIDLSEDYKLSSPEAFCDYNNIANKWVLSKIDFQNSNIRIASTSLKR